MLLKCFSSIFLTINKQYLRIKSKAYSVLASYAFEQFGEGSILVPPIRLHGENRISIGDHVYIGTGSWLQTLPKYKKNNILRIGNNTSIGSYSVISASINITIEDNVLMASNICIVDHIHKYINANSPIKNQGIDKIAPVRIGQNTWVGQNAVILPGVTIGKNCVIGANSVVNRSIPDYSIAVGVPAKVVKRIINKG